MTAQLHDVLDAAKALSPLDQIELMQKLEETLATGGSFAFWTIRSLDELARAQHVMPVNDIDDLKADFWPEDESADDVIGFIREQRQHDRQ